MSAKAKLYHITIFGFYVYVLSEIHKNNQSEVVQEYEFLRNTIRFSPRYLTNWTFTLQLIYFGSCVACHFLDIFSGLRKTKEKLDKFNNFIFTAIATPMAFIVTSVFWSFYLYDRELIFPKLIDLIMPAWINHSLHTLNSVWALGDIYLVNHRFPSNLQMLKGLLYYILPYSVCIFGTYWQHGLWLYPFLGKISWTLIVVFTLLVPVCALMFFVIAKSISHSIWGTPLPEKTKKNNKNKYKKAN